ncbi:MAG: L,D-transpeptidase family protein [bacterium]
MDKKAIVYRPAFALLILIVGMFLFLNSACHTLPKKVSGQLKERMIRTASPTLSRVGEEPLYAAETLSRFYARRSYNLAWSDEIGILPEAKALIKSIHKSGSEGLNPEDYHLEAIEKTISRIREEWFNKKKRDPSLFADLDLLLTDAFLVYDSHLLSGRLNPETFDPAWVAHRDDTDHEEVLQKALHSRSIQKILMNHLPSYPGYRRLKGALTEYRMIIRKGGWPELTPEVELKNGVSDRAVGSLQSILTATRDLLWHENENNLFDDHIERALHRFQQRHGLESSGMVDPATLRALNCPPEQRLRQIQLNLERWRWLPQELGRRYIMINIPGFELYVIEDERVLMTMRVIVGKPDRQTPVFSKNMSYLVLNPRWRVPKEVVIQDLLPKIRKDISYLPDRHFRVFQYLNGLSEEIDPTLINWAGVDENAFPYRLQQEPGPMNPLGRVKFIFPNRFSVYLHDTPSRELFKKMDRSLSAGCIRVEKPIELAEYILRGDPKWTVEKIIEALEEGSEVHIQLRESIPVHILYWTAWVKEDGTLYFRDDIYGRDELLDNALKSRNCSRDIEKSEIPL